MNRMIKGSQILADIRAGMKRSALMKKYALSPDELRSAFQQIRLEREARIAAILTDVTQGMTHLAIMKKHKISSGVLDEILSSATTLTDEQQLPQSDGHPVDLCDHVTIDFRTEPRHKPLREVSARDHKRNTDVCVLRNISNRGLCLSGTRARVEEICHISVLGDESGLVTPFELNAECRWRHTGDGFGQPLAGFRISRISPANLNRLCDFIEHHTRRI